MSRHGPAGPGSAGICRGVARFSASLPLLHRGKPIRQRRTSQWNISRHPRPTLHPRIGIGGQAELDRCVADPKPHAQSPGLQLRSAHDPSTPYFAAKSRDNPAYCGFPEKSIHNGLVGRPKFAILKPRLSWCASGHPTPPRSPSAGAFSFPDSCADPAPRPYSVHEALMSGRPPPPPMI